MGQLIRNILSKNLQIYRAKKGYKREELSLMLGFDNSYISKVEKSKVNVTIDKLDLIAKALGVEVCELLSGD